MERIGVNTLIIKSCFYFVCVQMVMILTVHFSISLLFTIQWVIQLGN